MESIPDSTARLLEAASFAARAHQGQLRKDRRTPYVGHVYRVCLVLRQVFSIDDPDVLTVALLHDTIEDTTTDFDDVHDQFGPEVASWVALLTKDKRLQDEPREAAYWQELAGAPWQVKACKLADIYDNLVDSTHLSEEGRRKAIERSHYYLAALDDPEMPEPVRAAHAVVQALVAEVEARGSQPEA
jgi:guanosine-3',5'-bis(diphosphate) 3'-pyrophosphohydrolase